MDTKDIKALEAAMVRVRDLHTEMIGVVKAAEKALKAPSKMEDLVDATWFIRQSAEHAEDIRKMLNRLQETAINKTCSLWLTKTNGEAIRGEFAVGSPDVKDVPRIPSRSSNPGEYDAVLRNMGIPEPLIESGVMRVHFEGIGDYCNKLQSEGKPIPDFLLKQGEPYTVFKMRLVATKTNPYV